MRDPSAQALDEELSLRVLERLGVSATSLPDTSTLFELYRAWCRQIPFDNLLKIIHVRSGAHGPLPGTTPDGFFRSWLDHGTGGTCWAGSEALHSLLTALGYDAERALGTMLAAPTLLPNHGSIRVTIEENHYLLDSSILHAEPLLLDEDAPTAIHHPAWGVTCEPRDHRWYVRWRPLHKTDGFDCRFECFGLERTGFSERYAATGGWSPFNYQVCARRIRGSEVRGLAFGNFVVIHSDGSVQSSAVSDAERRRVLLDEFGMSQEIVNQLPADIPTPPAPGSRTAAMMESHAITG